MALSNQQRQARHRLRAIGRRGDPCPPEVKDDYTSEGRELTEAWAEGVWAYQQAIAGLRTPGSRRGTVIELSVPDE